MDLPGVPQSHIGHAERDRDGDRRCCMRRTRGPRDVLRSHTSHVERGPGEGRMYCLKLAHYGDLVHDEVKSVALHDHMMHVEANSCSA